MAHRQPAAYYEGMKMKLLSPVLRPVNKARKSASSTAKRTCVKPAGQQPGEQAVAEKLLVELRVQLQSLSIDCDPVTSRLLTGYLEAPAGPDKAFLDKWEECGRRDARLHLPVSLKNTAKATFTPFGLACLVRYSRGYLDELESMTAGLQQSSYPPPLGARGTRSRSTAE